jgi:hypothetical protein
VPAHPVERRNHKQLTYGYLNAKEDE